MLLKPSVRLFAGIIVLAGSFACTGAPTSSHPAAPVGSGGIDMNDSALPENQPLPAPRRMHVVADAAELEAAIEAAAPGDHIILEDGSYGAVTIGRDFPAGDRLVIRARNLLQASFTGLTITGDGIIVSGVSVEGGEAPPLPDSESAGVRIAGDDVRLTRCKVDAQGAYHALTSGSNGGKVEREQIARHGWGSRRLVVDHCEFTRWERRGIFFQYPTSDIIFARNHLHGNTACSLKNSQPCTSAAVGENWYDRWTKVNAVLRFNYFEDQDPGDFIHMKSSGNTVAFNVMRGPAHIQHRQGMDDVYVGNYAPESKIQVKDYRTIVIGNVAREIQVHAGNSSRFSDRPESAGLRDASAGSCITWNCAPPGKAPAVQPATRDGRLAGNSGPLIVGIPNRSFRSWCQQDPVPVENVTIYQHDRAPTLSDMKDLGGRCTDEFSWVKNLTDRWDESTPADWYASYWWGAKGLPRPAAFGKSDVGPYAP